MAFNPCTMEPWGFPDDSDGNESACNAGDLGSLLALGRSPGEGNGNPLQYSWLENSVDRSYGPWVCKESDTTERLTHSRCGAPGLWACFLAATEGGWDSHPTSPREFHLCHLLDSHVHLGLFLDSLIYSHDSTFLFLNQQQLIIYDFYMQNFWLFNLNLFDFFYLNT